MLHATENTKTKTGYTFLYGPVDWKDSPCRPDTRSDHLLLYRCRMPAVRFRDRTEDQMVKWQVLNFHKQRINDINQSERQTTDINADFKKRTYCTSVSSNSNYLSYRPKHVSRGFTICPAYDTLNL